MAYDINTNADLVKDAGSSFRAVHPLNKFLLTLVDAGVITLSLGAAEPDEAVIDVWFPDASSIKLHNGTGWVAATTSLWSGKLVAKAVQDTPDTSLAALPTATSGDIGNLVHVNTGVGGIYLGIPPTAADVALGATGSWELLPGTQEYDTSAIVGSTPATEVSSGFVELATQQEADDLIRGDRVITPTHLEALSSNAVTSLMSDVGHRMAHSGSAPPTNLTPSPSFDGDMYLEDVGGNSSLLLLEQTPAQTETFSQRSLFYNNVANAGNPTVGTLNILASLGLPSDAIFANNSQIPVRDSAYNFVISLSSAMVQGDISDADMLGMGVKIELYSQNGATLVGSLGTVALAPLDQTVSSSGVGSFPLASVTVPIPVHMRGAWDSDDAHIKILPDPSYTNGQGGAAAVGADSQGWAFKGSFVARQGASSTPPALWHRVNGVWSSIGEIKQS